MRLNRNLRSAFVRAVMDDVPHIDYDEMIHKLFLDWHVGRLPPAVRRVWDNKATRDYICLQNVYVQVPELDDYVSGGYVPCLAGQDDDLPDKWVMDQVVRFHKADAEQTATNNSLQQKLSTSVESCYTTQQLRKLLPEFDKYIPKDESVTQGVPALANLVTDFVKAGWPKGGVPA